jgi:hypothetical protein
LYYHNGTTQYGLTGSVANDQLIWCQSHSLHEVSATQVEQVLGVCLNESLLELGQRDTREVRLPLTCSPDRRDEYLVVVKPIIERTVHRQRPHSCGKRRQVERLNRPRFVPRRRDRLFSKPVSQYLTPHGVRTSSSQPGFEERELLDERLSRESLRPHKATCNRTAEALERCLLRDAEFLADDRFKHLIDRRTSP